MKAVQFQSYGSPDVLKIIKLDVPSPAAGEVLIRIESASVNYSDVARRSNAPYPFPTPLPFIPGSEVSGVIEALGVGVDGPPVGTPVFALVGQGANGYAQYAVTPAAQVIPIPPGIDFNTAAALPVAGTTALLILRDIAQLQPGENVLVQGAAGGVGSYAVQIARVLGAGMVIGATSAPAKFEAIRELGADHVIDYTQPNWHLQVDSLTNGRGVNLLLEMNGGDSFAQSLRCLAPFGRAVVYGTASRKPLRFDDQSILHFFYNPSLNQSIHVFNLGLWFGLRSAAAGQAMGDLIGLVASGQVKVPVNHVLPLTQASEAHRLMEERRTTGKIILKPWQE
ncbi:MAG: NADPH:quinone oxidoreductase family protein [Anaerolineae bacterium]|nr:NADPH:quinone oxidoreductase family protein [Anaerolineae bacterium]